MQVIDWITSANNDFFLTSQLWVSGEIYKRRADLVGEKHLANYCEYFDFLRRAYVPPAENTSREDKARDTLKKLLGD